MTPPHGYHMAVTAIATLNESAGELREFHHLYLNRFDPQDPFQLFLVEMMFESHVNLRRVARWKAQRARRGPINGQGTRVCPAAPRLRLARIPQKPEPWNRSPANATTAPTTKAP